MYDRISSSNSGCSETAIKGKSREEKREGEELDQIVGIDALFGLWCVLVFLVVAALLRRHVHAINHLDLHILLDVSRAGHESLP
jgi:hypothetical protein